MCDVVVTVSMCSYWVTSPGNSLSTITFHRGVVKAVPFMATEKSRSFSCLIKGFSFTSLKGV